VRFDSRLPDDAVNVSPTHPAREALTLVAGVAVGVMALVVVLAIAIEAVIPWIPPSFEARIFSNRWLASARNTDADRQAPELDDLLARLAVHWADNPYDLHIVAIDDPTPNAFAFPGGWIGVTTGLLDSVESENELAFVVAHEIGHFRDRDHLRGIGRGLAFALAMSALGLTTTNAAMRVATISGDLTARAFDRSQESRADRFALAVVAAEYGHIGGAMDFLTRLPRPEDGAHDGIRHYFSTHPLGEKRTDALRLWVRENGWPDEGPLRPWSGRAFGSAE